MYQSKKATVSGCEASRKEVRGWPGRSQRAWLAAEVLYKLASRPYVSQPLAAPFDVLGSLAGT